MAGKIVISGATGFVGQNLKSYIGDFELELISRENLKSAEIFSNCEVFIHLAGKAHDLKKVSLPEEYYEINYEITKNLYTQFLKSGAKKFIFISTVKAAADLVENVLTESDVPNPLTHYGKSKLMAENFILDQKKPHEKSFYILRPCMIHGPGNKGNLNLLYNIVKKGIPYPLAAFNNRRSFLSIENLCFVIKELIKQDVPSGIYQIADDESLSTTEVVKILAERAAKKPRFISVPPILIKFVARIGDVLNLPLNSERLQKLTENYEVSNTKIKNALRLKLPVSAKEGLRKTCDSFLNSTSYDK